MGKNSKITVKRISTMQPKRRASPHSTVAAAARTGTPIPAQSSPTSTSFSASSDLETSLSADTKFGLPPSISSTSPDLVRKVPDDEREYMTLDELKPHQLTELSCPARSLAQSQVTLQQQSPASHPLQQQTPSHQHHHPQQQTNHHHSHNPTVTTTYRTSSQHSIYYDVSAHPAVAVAVNSALTSIYGERNELSSMQQQQHSELMKLENVNPQTPLNLHHEQGSECGSRKRKFSFGNGSSDLDDDQGDDAKSVRTTDENKKQNHSEIEKRRRDKMNTYITELSAMVPMCHAMSRKLDKLTVLRMAVQHLKTIRGAVHSYTEGHYKPAFLSDQELKMLILQAADGFLFVVGCDRGKILFVSESVSKVLNYSQSDLLGQNWFDILHPKDVAKVKEQLSSSDLSPRERLIDAKTMLPVKTDVPTLVSRLCPGARRSFFCRMKSKIMSEIKEESDSSSQSQRRKKQISSDKKYCVIQCTGYLKSWAPSKIGLEEQEGDGEGDSSNLSCLVAIGRIQPNIFQSQIKQDNDNNANTNGSSHNNPNFRNIQFMSRHTMDGKFLFVDQRATLVLGFLPQELLGTSMYEYYHHEDIPALAEFHKAALQGNDRVTSPVYRLRTKDNTFIKIQSEWKAFRNPWTKDIEYLIAKNNVILSDMRNIDCHTGYRIADGGSNHVSGNFDFFNQSNGREIQNIINTHVEASKIGRKIANQVLDCQRPISNLSVNSPELSSLNRTSISLAEHSTTSTEPQMSALASAVAVTAAVTDVTVASTSPPTTAGASQSQLARAEGSAVISQEVQQQQQQQQQSRIISPPPPTRINGTLPGYSQVRNNVMLRPDQGNPELGDAPDGPPNPQHTEETDEAAMAVLMSLLEAEAGLGGPVDFSHLPWPLP